MPTITIDNVEYDTDSMSKDAIANLQSIQFVDAEIARLQAVIATMNTARLAYGTVLSELLEETVD